MQENIKLALEYIEKNKTLVEIKEYCKWKKQGIIKDMKRSTDSDFIFDRDIVFVDGTQATIWL